MDNINYLEFIKVWLSKDQNLLGTFLITIAALFMLFEEIIEYLNGQKQKNTIGAIINLLVIYIVKLFHLNNIVYYLINNSKVIRFFTLYFLILLGLYYILLGSIMNIQNQLNFENELTEIKQKLYIMEMKIQK